MRLSKVEFLAMNNPIRRYVQKHLELKIIKEHLKKHNISLEGKIILDAGCGSGYSTQLIINEFKPSKIFAFDFMEEQIRLAKKRNLVAEFSIGDVANINFDSNTFDAVFVFGVLHHVPEWRKALSEIARVLKPGGIFIVEELNGFVITIANILGFTHPKEAQFKWNEFISELNIAGFRILEQKKIILNEAKSFLCRKEGDK